MAVHIRLLITLHCLFSLQFLSEDTFLSKPLSLILLLLHLGTLAYLAVQWLKASKSKRIFLGKPLSADYVVYTMMVSNFVGIVFAKTLHYQFYSWYFHAIPLLLWISPTYPVVVRVLFVGVIEYAFNVFPATPISSALLQVVHLLILVSLKTPAQLNMAVVAAAASETKTNKKQE